MALKQSWTIAHLQTEEPDAAPYLDDHHMDWDDSTLASTPSIKRGISPMTTILRDAGEPCGIIISVEQKQRRFSASRRAIKRLLRLIGLILSNFPPKRKNSSNASAAASTLQPSLGVNGVMV